MVHHRSIDFANMKPKVSLKLFVIFGISLMVIKLEHSLHAEACKLEISCSWFRSKKIVFQFYCYKGHKFESAF